MSDLNLVIFDVDGTLIDSQAHIIASMNGAFARLGLTPPSREATLSIVGLSLPIAMHRLAPEHAARNDDLVAAYKESFAQLRQDNDGVARSPFFPGAVEMLAHLAQQEETFLAIATGKSRRGLQHIFETHSIGGLFQSVQCADDHPSKPHPSMVEACLNETGVDAARAAILGDTTYDIEMGRAAGIHAIGVSWGYHPVDDLRAAGAREVIDDFALLPAELDRIWRAK